MSDKAMKKVSKSFPELTRSRVRRLARDEGGAIAVMFALMLAALLGMMALAMDLGKAWNLETELQHAADACALSGATQLDGTAGARARAMETCVNNATAPLIGNQQRFASDGVGADVTFDTNTAITSGGPDDGKALNQDIKFYTQLPTDPANEATSDAEARFIEANVASRRVDFSFAAMVGAVTAANPRGRAVAGWESFYCDVPPMMMCNPGEPAGGDANAPFDLYSSCPDYGDGNTSCVGRGITMKARAGAPEPGDFGFLCVSVLQPDGTTDQVCGANNLKDVLASISAPEVCTGNQVTTEPGNMASLEQYINMRFDLYPNLADAMDPDHQPAYPVGRGLVTKASFDPAAGNCKYTPQSPADPGDWEKPRNGAGDLENYLGPGMHTANPGGPPLVPGPPGSGDLLPPIRAMAYPKDACNHLPVNSNEGVFGPIDAGVAGCLFKVPPGNPGVPEGEQIGTTQYDLQTYLDVYHPGMTEADLIADGADLANSVTPPIGSDGFISRWELYNWEKREIAGAYPNMAFEEEPICYKGGEVFEVDYDLPEPPADASTLDRRIIVMAVVNCEAMGGGRKTVDRTQPHGNVAVFLTEPMGYTVPDTLFGELVDPSGIGAGDVDATLSLIRERILLIE